MITLDVHTQNPYKIFVTDSWSEFSCANWAGEKVCVVTDTNVAPLYLQSFCQLLTGKKVFTFVIEAGEQSKNAQNYLQILQYLAQNAFTRKDTVVALGGGVVGDLSGFVAATYMRGIGFYQVPTTLLAMIDSSVGGKTAIDLPQGKNLVGTFYQPFGVYINLSTLATLPQKELDNGKGELVKYAFLSKTVTKEMVQNISADAICECLKIKAHIVAQDEKDNGIRALLNLGHTVGHAIETLSGFALPHGLCVAKGLGVAISISQKYYGFSEGKYRQMMFLLESAQLDLSVPFDKQKIAEATAHDKKALSDSINFVLIADIGDCRVEKIYRKDLIDLL